MSPAQKLEQCKENFLPRPVPNLAQMNALVGTTYTRTIQATHGIQIHDLHFHSSELKELRFKLMKNRQSEKQIKVQFVFNRRESSSITVLVPNGMTSIIVPNRDKTISPGTSLGEYKAMKKALVSGLEN